MYPNPQTLDQICQMAPAKIDQLCQAWKVPREVGQDIVKLALFDIIIYVGMTSHLQFCIAIKQQPDVSQMTVAQWHTKKAASASTT